MTNDTKSMTNDHSTPEPQLRLQNRAKLRQILPFNQKARQSSNFLKNIMLVEGALEIVLAGGAARSRAGSDDAVYHVHVAVAPGGKLRINFEQEVYYLKRRLQHRVASEQEDKKPCPTGLRTQSAVWRFFFPKENLIEKAEVLALIGHQAFCIPS